ncbi:hypothetical protein [uncultured Methanobrevibacter sp.]|uniref:hypothetical protein n=1 Tax=uncultured Methanobrevibacter sp. TaxID=253161 RepID=UPI0025EC3930|nr:hypothetical protein [uncultured Methanobrevibacter sp.]
MVLSISEILNGRDDFQEYHVKSLGGEICLRPLTSGEWDRIDEIKQKDLGDYTINEKTFTKKKRRVKGEMESRAKFNINASSKATKKAMYEAIRLSTANEGNPEKWSLDQIKRLHKNEVLEIYEIIEEISGANDEDLEDEIEDFLENE